MKLLSKIALFLALFLCFEKTNAQNLPPNLFCVRNDGAIMEQTILYLIGIRPLRFVAHLLGTKFMLQLGQRLAHTI